MRSCHLWLHREASPAEPGDPVVSRAISQEEQSGASPGEGITTGLYLRRVSQGLVGCEVVSAYPSSVERRLLQPLLAGRFPVARKRPWC